jgi:adhesin transport system membrane fusion protein
MWKQFYRRLGEAPHLSKSVLLEETGIPHLMRAVVLFGATILLAFCFWAVVATVDEIAVATGEIVPLSRGLQVQHLRGGIIQEIVVRDGMLVKEGQVLIRLDPYIVRANLAQAQIRRNLLLVEKERVEAFVERRSPDFHSDDFHDKSLIKEQTDLYHLMLKSWKTSRRILQEQVEQAKAEMVGLYAQESKFGQQKSAIEREIELLGQWLKRGAVVHSKIDSLGLQRELSTFSGGLQETSAKHVEMVHKISELRSRLIQLDLQIMEAALNHLVDIKVELAQVNETVSKNEQDLNLLNIRSPVDGWVHSLSFHTIGGVVQPGATLFEVVPEAGGFVAEVKVTARDVGHVRVGQSVVVKFTTYEFGRYGGINGELTDLSPTAFFDRDGSPYHRGVVTLERAYIGPDPQLFPVRSGMVVHAGIRTGNKTIMEYLLRPIYTSADNALRER